MHALEGMGRGFVGNVALAGGGRILLSTLGTTGDVLPFAALARQLVGLGFEVTLLANENHRTLAENMELPFAATGAQDWPQFERDEQAFFERVIIPGCYTTYDALRDLAALGPPCLLVNRTGHWGAAFSAERLGLPVVRLALQPCAIRKEGHPVSVFGLSLLNRFRDAIGLPPASGAAGLDEPALGTISLFNHEFGRPQSRWPQAGYVAGFPAAADAAALPTQVSSFLHRYKPVVFSVGSGAGEVPAMHEVAMQLSREYPVLFLSREAPPGAGGDRFLWQAHANHDLVFQHAEAVVHNGGIGTVAASLRSGLPQIVIPLGYDQPDNARRVCRMGAGTVITLGNFNVVALRAALQSLRAESTWASEARVRAARMLNGDGVRAAAVEVARLAKEALATTVE